MPSLPNRSQGGKECKMLRKQLLEAQLFKMIILNSVSVHFLSIQNCITFSNDLALSHKNQR